MKRAMWTLAIAAIAMCGAAQSAMVSKTLDYEVDGKKMQSVLVYDDAGAKRPGLVMAPDWMGMNADQIELAKQYAGKDYVVLVADVYGTELRPKNPDEAGAATKAMYADRKVLRARIGAALNQLKAQAGKAPLDGSHYAAFGFCFGGATVLDLARSGADVAAVVSFHGNLASDDVSLATNIKAKVLAMNGADDKYVPAEQIATFEKEMTDAKVDWQFLNYSGAVHCFAIPTAHGQVPGCMYDERTARRSASQMRNFLKETFATP